MKEIFIEYNPYRLTTKVLVDGEEPTEENNDLSLHNIKDKRIQEWIEDLPEIVERIYCDRDFELTFHGTALDYEDVEAVARAAEKNGFNITTKHIPAKESEKDKLAEIDKIFAEIQKGPFDGLKTPDVNRAFKNAMGKNFEVIVVATMSSGKSTLINALLGKKLMPAKSEPCTAVITKIKDDDKEAFKAEVYNKEGKMIGQYSNIDLETMKELNDREDVAEIFLEGDIPFVSSSDESLVLIDTPGPNNSRNKEHKKTTYRALNDSSKPMIMYLFDATQIGTDDSENFLNDVAECMKVGGKQSRDRFIFVVNKMDEYDPGDEAVKNPIDSLRENLKGKEIENANIYPASALAALYIRTVFTGSAENQADRRTVREAESKVWKFMEQDYIEMQFEKLAPLPPSAQQEIERRLEAALDNKDDKNEVALIHCGIVPIEMAIRSYVEKYAKSAKIKNVVDTFRSRLESSAAEQSLIKEIAENQDQREEILRNIEKIEAKLESGKEAESFKKRVDEIDYSKEIEDEIFNLSAEVMGELSMKIVNYEMTREEAKDVYQRMKLFSEEKLTSIFSKIEQMLENNVRKSAEELLEEYSKKISAFSDEIEEAQIKIEPFEIMKGDISGIFKDIDAFLEESEETGEKKEKVGTHLEYKELFGAFKNWMNELLGSDIFDVVYETIEDYNLVKYKYIPSRAFSEQYVTPIEEKFWMICTQAQSFAKRQTEIVKAEFSKKFDELDAVLKKKLDEFRQCAENRDDLERRIDECEKKLQWLKDITARVDRILDI